MTRKSLQSSPITLALSGRRILERLKRRKTSIFSSPWRDVHSVFPALLSKNSNREIPKVCISSAMSVWELIWHPQLHPSEQILTNLPLRFVWQTEQIASFTSRASSKTRSISFSPILRNAWRGSIMTLSNGMNFSKGSLSWPGISSCEQPVKNFRTSSIFLRRKKSFVAVSCLEAKHHIQKSTAEAALIPSKMARNFQSPERKSNTLRFSILFRVCFFFLFWLCVASVCQTEENLHQGRSHFLGVLPTEKIVGLGRFWIFHNLPFPPTRPR